MNKQEILFQLVVYSDKLYQTSDYLRKEPYLQTKEKIDEVVSLTQVIEQLGRDLREQLSITEQIFESCREELEKASKRVSEHLEKSNINVNG